MQWEPIEMKDDSVVELIEVRKAAKVVFVVAAICVTALVDAGSAQAQTRTERAFDDWKVVCVETEEGSKRCSMSQALVQRNSRREIFRWLVAVDRQGEMVNVLSAPLGVSLRPGVELLLGDAEPVAVPFELCGRRWCQARLPMSPQISDPMATGMPVQVTYVNPRGQQIRMEVTVRGYHDAFSYLQSELGS